MFKSPSHVRWFYCSFVSGNIHVNPGPLPSFESLYHFSTPAEFANRHGLGFLHMNEGSLLPKLDVLKTWFMLAKPDFVVISETWLKPSVSDNVMQVGGFNVFQTDRKGRAGGVAIYVSNKFNISVLLSLSVPRQFEILAIHISFPNSPLTIIGCYRPPSAVNETISSWTEVLSNFSVSEIILIGDLNWDWLSDKSDHFKSARNSLNWVQLIDSPTRVNPSKPNCDSFLDVMLTNRAHKYSASGMFANDMSDHCVIGCVRSTKILKSNGFTV